MYLNNVFCNISFCLLGPAQWGAPTLVQWGFQRWARGPRALQMFLRQSAGVSPPAAPGPTPHHLLVRTCPDMSLSTFDSLDTLLTWIECESHSENNCVCICSGNNPWAAGSLLLSPAEPRASQPQLLWRSVHGQNFSCLLCSLVTGLTLQLQLQSWST